MGGGKSKRQSENGHNSHIDKAKSVDNAKSLRYETVVDKDGDVRVRIRTYVWDHDGPKVMMDYETIFYFYEKNSDTPLYAITFSHYGLVYHYNLKSWDNSDFSPRFNNDYHTPVLNSDVHIENGPFARPTYLFAKISGLASTQSNCDAKEIKGGLPKNHQLRDRYDDIKENWEVYMNECREHERNQNNR